MAFSEWFSIYIVSIEVSTEQSQRKIDRIKFLWYTSSIFFTSGRLYAQRRGRRQSKEFEDLNMDTRTGSLKQPFNVAKRVLSSHSRVKSSSLDKISSPRLQRSSTSLGGSRTRLKSSDHSDGSSSSAISSLEDLHWIGDPEATKSVRRNRKSSEEQHLEYELKRIASSKRQVTKKNSK